MPNLGKFTKQQVVEAVTALEAEYYAEQKAYESGPLHVGMFPSYGHWIREKAVELKILIKDL